MEREKEMWGGCEVLWFLWGVRWGHWALLGHDVLSFLFFFGGLEGRRLIGGGGISFLFLSIAYSTYPKSGTEEVCLLSATLRGQASLSTDPERYCRAVKA